MNKFWPLVTIVVLVLLGTFLIAKNSQAAGCTPFLVASGGTGGCTWNSSQLLYGAGTNALKTIATTSVTAGTGISFTSFTAIGSSPITITASGGSTFPFTPFANYNATSTTLGFLNGFFSNASSTINASTTIAGQVTLTGATTTSANGFSIGTGCFAIAGNCLTAGAIGGGFTAAANWATTGVLGGTPTYVNGTAGVGATLTEVGTGALSVDSNSPAVNDRVLVKNQASACQNGIYSVTATGSGIASYILTRATDYNAPTEITPGINTYIISGTTNSDSTWAVSFTPPLTISCSGGTNLNYSESAAAGTVISVSSANGIQGGTITNTGTLSLISYMATSSLETSGQIPFWTSTGATPALLSGGVTGFAWDNTNSKFTATNASSTASTISTALYIPNAANPTMGSTVGRIAIDTTAASSSIHWVDGAGNEQAVFASTSVSFVLATSSPSTAATTTIVIAGPIRKVSYVQIGCNTVGGTSNVQLGDGISSTTMVVASNSLTTTFTNLTSNNAFIQGHSRLFAVGTYSAGSVTQTTCSLSQVYDPN